MFLQHKVSIQGWSKTQECAWNEQLDTRCFSSSRHEVFNTRLSRLNTHPCNRSGVIRYR